MSAHRGPDSPDTNVTRTSSTLQEDELLRAARTGDEDAFRRLVEPHRRELHAHCYRMLGSVDDAEDALQETLLHAWRGLSRFAGRSSFRTWLYRITTNACLDAIARRPKRVLPIDYGQPSDPHPGPYAPIVESVWIEPYPDETADLGDRYVGPEAHYEQRESVELAFVAALQHLPAQQRAVLILREVLGFSAREAADILDSTVASVNSALQRARKAADERLPAESQQATLRSLGDERIQGLVESYMRAWEEGDVDGIVALLTDDATITMPPCPTWFQGRDAVAGFLTAFAFAREGRGVRLVPTGANGQPAFGSYRWEERTGTYEPVSLHVLTLRQARIAEINTFVDPTVFARFGLPQRLP
jgi:RNA polymerase sigma-70 factor (ECF subfamily)